MTHRADSRRMLASPKPKAAVEFLWADGKWGTWALKMPLETASLPPQLWGVFFFFTSEGPGTPDSLHSPSQALFQ